MLKVENVECRYGSTKILEDINFEVGSGDFMGLIGPNGSGKTTLLRSISRTLKPVVGMVFLNGRDIYSLKTKEVAREVGVVPQATPPAAFAFTVLEMVLMGRTPHLKLLESEGKRDYAIAENVMKLTDTWHLADRLFTELSGGEQQRVVIARALAQEPRVLLLDEPTSHLDISYQVEILNLLKRLCKQEGLTVIAVFHDLNLAAQYCDYLILLNQGEIESMGTTEEVLTPENIRRVYRTEVIVKRHPITNSIYLIPFSTPEPQGAQGFTVHLICGGGTGAPLMGNLLKQGYRVTAGILNTLDTDYEVATHLNIPVVTDPPFSPASEEAHGTNLEFVERADVVVLTDTPIGWGNMKNLDAAKRALERKIPLVMIEKTPFEKRDFTGGEARRRLCDLKKMGARCVGGLKEFFSVLDLIRKKSSIDR